MPPRKKKQKRRRDTAISITGLAEAVMLANVGTKAAFNLSAWDWLSDGWRSGTSAATNIGELSLYEMIYGNTATTATVYLPGQGATTQTITPGSNADVIMTNLRNNWMPAAIQSIAIPVGFRLVSASCVVR